MKSIKETANEYAKEYLFSTLPQRAPNVHFEAGANYVFDEIEELLTKNSSLVIKKSVIKAFIEQLKGNQ